MEDYGLCESCVFASSSGELGTIKDCDCTEDFPEFAEEWEDMIGEDKDHQCPNWKPESPVYCMKHHKWNPGTWQYACDECLDEYVRSEEFNKSICAT